MADEVIVDAVGAAIAGGCDGALQAVAGHLLVRRVLQEPSLGVDVAKRPEVPVVWPVRRQMRDDVVVVDDTERDCLELGIERRREYRVSDAWLAERVDA